MRTFTAVKEVYISFHNLMLGLYFLYTLAVLSYNIILWFSQLDPKASLKDFAGFKQESIALILMDPTLDILQLYR